MALTLYNLGLCRAHLGQPQPAVRGLAPPPSKKIRVGPLFWEKEAALKRALRLAERLLGSEHRQAMRQSGAERATDTAQKSPAEPKRWR